LSAGIRYDHGAATHQGAVRKANEDSVAVSPSGGLWAVADGMGGHENGSWASSVIADRLKALGPAQDFDAQVRAAVDALHAANETIYARAQAAGATMGSTAVVLVLGGRRFAALWAGDSRIYLRRAGLLHRLTRDHTQVEDLVEHGVLTPEEALGHPMRHVLSRAVGTQELLEIDAVTDQVEVGDTFLLCSDGLTAVVPEDEIVERMAAGRPGAAAQSLVELCLSRGAPDNVSVVLVTCEETTLLTLAGTDDRRS
jgi:serine/threonine-protein phosphatase Stp1